MEENREELAMTEIESSGVKSVGKKRGKLFAKLRRPKDFWDLVIIEVGVATAVLLVMLAVNVFGNGGIADVFSKFSATLSSLIV